MAATDRQVVFRADAGRSIGGGHVMRCLALADALRDEGWQPHFAGSPETRVTVKALGDADIQWHPLVDPFAPQMLTAAVPACDLLVVDSYKLDEAYESACRGWARAIMVIDDLADRRHDCDLLLDQSLGRVAADYRYLVPPQCRTLTGADFALLRADFALRRGQRQDTGEVRRIFLSLGMMDEPGFLLEAIPVIRALLPQARIDVVVGGRATHLEQLQLLAAGDARLILHVDADHVADLMQQVDIAVIGAGTTVLEACCVGLPAILLVVADNQRGIAAAMRSHSAVPVIETIAELGPALSRMVEDSTTRREAGSRLAALCDGRGARRVAMAIAPEVSGGQIVGLRRMVEADAAMLLAWQSDPVTRRFSRNPAIPSEREHTAWFAAKLRDPDCLFHILTQAETPVGMLRLDRRNDHGAYAYEVSILVAPERHGRGLGRAALALARRLVPEADLHAEVHADNLASHALFSAAGYRRRSGWYVSSPREGGAV